MTLRNCRSKMSICLNGSISDLLSDLESHKCCLCEKCLVCHHCLLARGYLRKREIDIPEVKVNDLLDVIHRDTVDDEDPPRYIFVGPNNEIIVTSPNVVHVQSATNTMNHSHQMDTYPEQFPIDIDPTSYAQELPTNIGSTTYAQNFTDIDPTTYAQDADIPEIDEQPGSEKDVEPVTLDQPEEPVSYDCKECDKTFSTEHDFNMHQIYHSVEEVHECKQCNKTFSYSYELIKHSLYHNGKSFVCQYCEKLHASEEKLKMHMRFHTGARPFVCTICGKAFKENATLKAHLLTHTDERPFQCDECGRSFRFKLKLEHHKWIHEGIKPYVCLVCEKAFRHKCNLRTHVKRHHNMSLEESVQEEDI